MTALGDAAGPSDGRAPRASEADALLHLVSIRDPLAETLVQKFVAIANVAERKAPWAHLEPHYKPVAEWSGLLDQLHMDAQNKK